MDYKIYVEVSDAYLWTLKPFAYLFKEYWENNPHVIVGGYSQPDFRLPDNFSFHQIDKHHYPANKWSDGMIRFISSLDDDIFVLLFCDYWLSRPVDVRGVQYCVDLIRREKDVLRVDLTADRLYAGGKYDIGYIGSYDIIETPYSTPYQMSFQAGVWRKTHFLNVMRPGLTAWESEIQIKPPQYFRVLGTRQWPIKYVNGIHKGKVDEDEMYNLPPVHRGVIHSMIPHGWEHEVE